MSHIVSSDSQPMESHIMLQKHFPIHGKDLSYMAVCMDKTDTTNSLELCNTVQSWSKASHI